MSTSITADGRSDDAATLAAADVLDRYGVDLTTAEVIRHALRFISLQMQRKINTAALSPLLSEVNDFGIGLLSPSDPALGLDHDAIAMGTAAPAHFVINQYYARMAIDYYGQDNFRPGDMIVYNDAFRGGSHANDIGSCMPIFVGDELIGFAAAITHWMDIGGPVPAGMGAGLQQDMYSEGIRMSPRLIYRQGELQRETLDLFCEQTRIAEISVNDIQVVRSALALGAEMVQHYVAMYGLDAYRGAVQYTLDYSERALRHALREIPDGVYEAEDHLDNNMAGDPMVLRCTVRKCEDRLEIDYSGSSREEWGGYASQWSDTVSAAHLGVANMLQDKGILPNAGSFRPIDVVVPAGSCLHALPPMSTNSGHTFLFTKALNLVKIALSKAGPELAVGENFDDVGVIGLAGLDTRQETPATFITMRLLSGPYGGSAHGDGCAHTMVEGANNVEPSIEYDEESYPILVLKREFVEDTAGPGQHRGGAGIDVHLVSLVPSEGMWQLEQCRFPTIGVLGGKSGATGWVRVHRNSLDAWVDGADLAPPEVLAGFADAETGAPVESEAVPGAEFRSSKNARVPFGSGDFIHVRMPGAAGYGDPADRDAAAVVADVRNGIYSTEAHARGAVSLNPES